MPIIPKKLIYVYVDGWRFHAYKPKPLAERGILSPAQQKDTQGGAMNKSLCIDYTQSYNQPQTNSKNESHLGHWAIAVLTRLPYTRISSRIVDRILIAIEGVAK